ncbi:MAG: tRNA 2-selenouridine(34) synthase MnmH [Cellulosilyticaceae bacterium]
MHKTFNDFRKIVLEDVPLLDVRAPIEYEKGAFKHSVNLPILTNEERHTIGICYKEEGNAVATALGYQLVSGEIKEARIAGWMDFFEKNPKGMLYCFRGGSRSRIAQEWICEALGHEVVRLEGGYKAFRNYLLDVLEPANQTSHPIILGGCTGSGKTHILKQLPHAIDLEGLANHRGSSFGRHRTPQPTQTTFENDLAYDLIKHQAAGYDYMIVEDEGRHIGQNFIPHNLAAYFANGDLVVVEVPLEERMMITLKEYVIDAQAEYLQVASTTDEGLHAWHTYISESMKRLKKRLGGDRYITVSNMVDEAFQHQLATGSYDAHLDWIAVFLRDYYDPMYRYQLEQTTKKIVFRGDTEAVLAYLRSLLPKEKRLLG